MTDENAAAIVAAKRQKYGDMHMGLIQTSVDGFAEYHKIETLFERDERFVVNPSVLKKSVLGTISAWEVTEKIDGTNVRVMLSESGEVTFGGRSNAAQLPADLYTYLSSTFTAERVRDAMWINGPTKAVLYGEGYGAGIQKGGAYRPDKAFILFDAFVGDKWWLDRKALEDIAGKLSIDVVPLLGHMTLEEIVELVRTPFPSKIGTALAEGIVARPLETLFDKRGERVIIKLKTRDFVAGKR